MKNRHNRQRRAKARSKFIKIPFNHAKKLLGGELKQNDVKNLATSQRRPSSQILKNGFDECSALISSRDPTTGFKIKKVQMEEVPEAVHRAKARSAPGYSGTAYKIDRKCSKRLKWIYNMVNAVWNKAFFPECWQKTEGCFVPKEEHSTFFK